MAPQREKTPRVDKKEHTQPLVQLRPDIIVSEVGDSCILKVKENGSNSYYKVPGRYAHILQRLREGENMAAVFEEYSDDDKALALRLISKLSYFNMLLSDGKAPLPGVPRQVKKKWRLSPFLLLRALRIKIFQVDPDRFLTWVYSALGLKFFYKKGFLVPAIASSVIMFVVLCENGFFSFSPPLLEQGPLGIAIFYVLVAIGILVHELAHSITCKHYGGEVNGLGLMVYFLMPAGFSDVSDSYLFDRMKRTWVLVAGPLTTVFIGIWLGALWLFTEKGTPFNTLVYILALISFLASLFNLNPLLRLDGYYLLTELVGIENLRKRSFQYVRMQLKHLFSRSADAAPEVSGTEKIIFLVYGVFGGLFFTFIILFLLSRLIRLLFFW